MHEDCSCIPLEDLLANAAWARRLALHLVSDRAAADDLVQETWLAAMRHPPSTTGPAKPWLRRVLVNVFRMGLRGDGRRTERERAQEADPDSTREVPSPEEMMARLEAHRLVAEAVRRLDEPLRQMLLLRYYEGMSAAEISRATGVPAGTVRWRLSEGLDRLRASLDERTPGGREQWCVMLGPLAIAARAPLAPAGGVTMVKSQVVKPVVVGGAALVLVAAVALLVLLQPWRPRPGLSPTPANAPGRAAPSLTARTSAAGAVATALVAGPRVALAEPTIETGADGLGWVEGVVVSWSTGRAVPGAELSFLCQGAVSSVIADAQGRFRLKPDHAGRCSVASVTAPGFLPFAPGLELSPIEIRFQPRTVIRNLRVTLTPALSYRGTVVDPEGRAVADATVRLLGARSGEQALHGIRESYRTDGSGRFTFHAPDGASLEASRAGVGLGHARLDRSAQIMHELTIRLRKDGSGEKRRIAGRVLDASSVPVPDAQVAAVGEGPDGVRSHATTDAQGAFVLEGLEPGPQRIVARTPGGAVATAASVLAGTVDLQLRASAGATLRGRVLGTLGAPVGAFTVVAVPRGAGAGAAMRQSLVVDPEGRFALDGLVAGSHAVVASADGFAPTAEVQVTLPTTEELELRLPRGGSLTGVVVSARSGAPLADARVTIESLRPMGSLVSPTVASTTTDERGRFELRGLAAGSRSVLVAAYRHGMRLVGDLAIVEGRALGPITVALTPTASGERATLEVVGVGLQLQPAEGGLRVQRVIAGGGAAELGVRAGDQITAIEGVSAASLSLEEAIKRLRGPAGTSVRVRLLKAGGGEKDLVVPRRTLRL
jgi:RNA polymerase sigma factor (sigma-70 family)